jgi:hypothetical protein
MARSRTISPDFWTREAIVACDRLQRVGKRARRRYPSAASTAHVQPLYTIANHSKDLPPPFGEGSAQPAWTRANHSNAGIRSRGAKWIDVYVKGKYVAGWTLLVGRPMVTPKEAWREWRL